VTTICTGEEGTSNLNRYITINSSTSGNMRKILCDCEKVQNGNRNEMLNKAVKHTHKD
jgi:hypothetical protein